jgi:DNA helicase-2/ATP-dependent DNA helicase PcrA
MDESGEKGLEEERRLAYVGITRARETARISFAANRQVYGRWTSQLPSRFVDEMPLANVDAASETGYYGGGPGMNEPVKSRWDDAGAFASTGSGYSSPGWRRAQANAVSTGGMPARPFAGGGSRQGVIEGEGRLIATSAPATSTFARGERVFHQKFGYGVVAAVEGNKLTVGFDQAGEKKVIDTFVERA